MTRRSLFNIAAALSLLLCISVILVWHREIQIHLPETYRVIQRRDELRRAIEHEPRGTPAYDRYVREEQELLTTLREQQVERESLVVHPSSAKAERLRQATRDKLAEHRHFQQVYVDLPEGVILALMVLPAWWILKRWRDWLPRVEHPPSRWRAIRRTVTMLPVTLCCIFAIGTAMLIPRSYYFVSDSLLFSTWFNRDGLAFWRQSIIRMGRGRIGFNVIVQSGPPDTYRRGTETSYRKRWGVSMDDVSHYSAYAPVTVDFQFGPDKKRWGLTWGYFEHTRAGAAKPINWGYEAIAPIWMLEILLLPVPLLWTCLWIRRRRWHRAGHCVQCGYNLSGNASGVCPECGTAVVGKQRVSQ